MKSLLYFLFGFLAASILSLALGTAQAAAPASLPKVVIYGRTSGGVLVPVQVSAAGVVQVNP